MLREISTNEMEMVSGGDDLAGGAIDAGVLGVGTYGGALLGARIGGTFGGALGAFIGGAGGYVLTNTTSTDVLIYAATSRAGQAGGKFIENSDAMLEWYLNLLFEGGNED
jgi:hypothetical protein